LNTARRQALILHNPAEAVELPRSKSLERKIFTSDEVRAMLSVAPPEWKTAILAGYYTGQRLSDVISLCWDQIDLAEGVIFFMQKKTAKRVEVPIHPELLDHLLTLAGDAPHGLLCPALANRATGGACGLSWQFEDLMNKAGVDRLVVQTSLRRRFPLKSFHSLRHSFASALCNAGVSADIRQKLTGHRSLEVHRRYSHLELEPCRKAIVAIPSLNHRDQG
jgi:integrase